MKDYLLLLETCCIFYQGAIVFSNIVTTVSPTYALEVRTPEVSL